MRTKASTGIAEALSISLASFLMPIEYRNKNGATQRRRARSALTS